MVTKESPDITDKCSLFANKVQKIQLGQAQETITPYYRTSAFNLISKIILAKPTLFSRPLAKLIFEGLKTPKIRIEWHKIPK
jgi:hypothetical protein